MLSYKKLFLVRFLAYFGVILSFVLIITALVPIVTEEVKYRRDQLFGIHHQLAPESANISANSEPSSEPTPEQGPEGRIDEGFGEIDSSSSNYIVPVSTEYGIVIEKINANAKVIPEVDPSDEDSYSHALANGVAAAKGSTKPGEPGNLFIFSHSADAPWNITRFNAIFYLLRELDAGDKVVIFYNGRRYNYVVYDKQIADPRDTSLLTNRYDKPVLTLQTCDPPGTLANRLIIRAQLAGS